MKNFKFLLLGLLVAVSFSCTAQSPSRGANGSNYTPTAMHICNAQGVKKTIDTLVNADTGFVYIWVGQGFDMSFDFVATTLSGTVATTSNILYGYNNGGKPLSPAQIATVTGSAITGNTTYCAGCVGASSTTVPGASKHYMWQVPNRSGALFDNYFIRTIQTGTATATYSASLNTQY